MSDFDFKNVAGVSFEEIFGSGQEGISYERVEAFLDQVVQVAAEQAMSQPNQLVRVVTDGKVTWMTQEQAAEFLESSDKEEIKRQVQRAIKGELKVIRQELEILLAIATYTLEQFKQSEAIDKKEIERLEPSLKRRQVEINHGVSNTLESETILSDKRRRAPLIEEYESAMGKFLNAKSRGNMALAQEYAQELSEKKKKYLLLTRAIEPDVRAIYYNRLDLQKTKKRILTTQNLLCSSRQDALKFELTQLQQNLGKIKDQVSMAEGSALDAAAEEINRLDVYDAESVEKELEEKSNELSALEQEQKAIKRQEQSTQAVIETIAEDVLNEPDLSADVQSALKSTQQNKIQSEPKPAPQEKQKRSGMHVRKSAR